MVTGRTDDHQSLSAAHMGIDRRAAGFAASTSVAFANAGVRIIWVTEDIASSLLWGEGNHPPSAAPVSSAADNPPCASIALVARRGEGFARDFDLWSVAAVGCYSQSQGNFWSGDLDWLGNLDSNQD
jgi:hypothetical protein